MTDAPLPPPLSPPPRKEPRPEVPLGATCLTLIVGFCAFLAASGAVAAVVFAKRAAPRIARTRMHRAESEAVQGRVSDGQSRLDALAARISASAQAQHELPEFLDEAAPRDPWGQPVEYERIAPDRAMLRSSGPDRRFGTKDDVQREIVLK